MQQKRPLGHCIEQAAWLLLQHPETAVRAAGCQLLDGSVSLLLKKRMDQRRQYDDALEVRAACGEALNRCYPWHARFDRASKRINQMLDNLR